MLATQPGLHAHTLVRACLQANQQWQTDSAGAIRSRHNTNFCLDASANANGATVYMFVSGWADTPAASLLFGWQWAGGVQQYPPTTP